MEEQNKKDEKDWKSIAIATGLISFGVFVVYRIGVKRGYKDAIKIVDATCDCFANSLDITRF